MTVKNRRTGQKFETNQLEFQRLITDQGNAYMYEVISDDVPIEVKSLREMKLKAKQEKGSVTEVKLK